MRIASGECGGSHGAGGVGGTTASLSIFNSVSNIVALVCLIMTHSSAVNYIYDMSGHSKELGTLE